MRLPAGNQFGEDEASLDGLAEANVVRQQQPDPRQLQGANDRDELVDFGRSRPGLAANRAAGPMICSSSKA